MQALLEQRPVGVAGLFVHPEKLDDFIAGYHRALAVRLGLGQSLAQVEQQNRIQQGQIGAAQQPRHFQIAGVGLAGKSHLRIAVDHQLQKQLGQAAANGRFVANQDRPEPGVAPALQGRAGEQLHQHAPGIQR